MVKNIMASTLVYLRAKIIKFLGHSEWISDKKYWKIFHRKHPMEYILDSVIQSKDIF